LKTPQSTPPLENRPSGRPNRRTRLPARFRDEPPPPPPPPPAPPWPLVDAVTTEVDPPTENVQYTPNLPPYKTDRNSYGVYRVYDGGPPSYTPDELHTLHHVSDSPNFNSDSLRSDAYPWWSRLGSTISTATKNTFAPFLNATTFHLMNWFHSGSNQKSLAELDRLVNDVILAPDFKADDLHGFRATREADRLNDWENKPDSPLRAKDGWVETSVKIAVPADGVKHSSEANAPQYAVPGVFYRPLLEVIRAAFSERAAEYFHLTPFESYWQPAPDSPPERIITDLYTSDAFIEEHKKIKNQHPIDGCQLETVVAAIMLWSDSTHLTSFGNASLWPIYLYLGNQSKYTRAKPSAFAAHHLAYMPKVCN
jgi:hypothetical protein